MAVKETRKKKEAVVPEAPPGEMHGYEMVVIFRPASVEAESEKQVESLKQTIEGLGGVISQMEPWGKKKLAYPIAHLTEANYVLAKFTIDPAKTGELQNKLRINDQEIRHMLIADES